MSEIALALCLGFAIDLAVGWPNWLYHRIGHPVGWLARPISACEKRWNHGTAKRRFWCGSLISLGAVALAVVTWGGLAHLAQQLPLAPIWMGLLFWPLIAARSMHDHVAAIARPLAKGDLKAARYAVSMIVGRDPNRLDAAGVARASLESLAENTSDGIVAPLFWGLILGPGGMAGYKAINTLDSMIAHRNARYEWFGKLAARLDDLANLIPARLTGVIYALVSPKPWQAVKIMWRDARAHRSPNAGWPEAALASGLGVRLSGPRRYGDHIANEPWLNGEAADPDAAAIAKGLAYYRRLLAVLAGMLILAVWLF